jgi:cephalosporin hydroxylase
MPRNSQYTARTAITTTALALLLAVLLSAAWSWFQGSRAAPSGNAAVQRVVERNVTDDEIVKRFSKLWYDSPDTWKRNRWLGILTYQNPDDVWIIQEIISEIRPDFVVETGTFLGGSAALWATILVQVNPQGRVISVDTEDNVTTARELPIVRERVEYLVGGSTDPDMVKQVKDRVQGKSVLIILDSDHSRDHVLKELEVYSPLVQVGGYLIVQDSNINGHPVLPEYGPGPMEAIEEFLKSNDEFEVDSTRERLLHTLHPKGYLRRVRAAAREQPAPDD